jgi:hypothetical protein
LHRGSKYADGGHFVYINQDAAIDFLVLQVGVIGPAPGVHELLERIFHIRKNRSVGCLNFGAYINGDHAIQFLCLDRGKKEKA